MTDDKKVTPIEEARQRRDEEANARGEMFAFEEYAFADETIGILGYENGQMVSLLTEGYSTPAKLSYAAPKGIFMTPDDAESLGVALIQAAFAARQEKDPK